MSRESERVLTIYDSEGELRTALDHLVELTGVSRSELVKRILARALSIPPVPKSAKPQASARKKPQTA